MTLYGVRRPHSYSCSHMYIDIWVGTLHVIHLCTLVVLIQISIAQSLATWTFAWIINSSAQFHIPDFVCYRQDLTSSSGGLLIYVRADLPHRRLNHIEINGNGFESLCTEITIGKTKTVLCCVYKHPKCTNDFFQQYMSKLGDAILQTYDDFVFELLP